MTSTSPAAGHDAARDYRYPRAKRKNNPPAGLAAQGRIADRPAEHYAYNPHLPPVMLFDGTGKTDRYNELLEIAQQRVLTEEEIAELAAGLRQHEPWLEWSGKREAKSFEVDPVALHIHERVAAKAILAVAARQDVQRSLFADPQLEYRQAVQFYQHDVDWSNRLILGDSLAVMSSLAKREGLAGQVQMIYLDPPYGIKFASNFQPLVGQRDVKDRPQDLTREPEVVKAYRDTWTLGIHSYLAYLRDRLILARELLTDSGSIFVQIGDENAHRVRSLMDDVFGKDNFVAMITFAKTSGFSGDSLDVVSDFILWYSKYKDRIKYRQLYAPKELGETGMKGYDWLELPNGIRRRLSADEGDNPSSLPRDCRIFMPGDMTSQGATNTAADFEFQGKILHPGKNSHWKATIDGRRRLSKSGRLFLLGSTLRYVRYADDFSVFPLNNVWTDTGIAGYGDPKIYVVQTNPKVIERCLLMTSDPGDLVLDPTCGSGTTAYVAERWGRRWITIDTSRVAIAIARQRLLTATYEYYTLRDEAVGVAGGLRYKTVPHITLKSIAQNPAIDAIDARHAPGLAERLAALNAALAAVSGELRTRLAAKLTAKERAEGKRAVTDADRRRWLLPKTAWQEWEVPFDTDPDWPPPLQQALTDYRAAWRAKMKEINDTIEASAEQEELVDQPEVERGVARVSGPFTVEAVLPPAERLDLEPSPVDELEEELPTFGEEVGEGRATHASPLRDGGMGAGIDQTATVNAAAHVEAMLRFLRGDGVRFPGNKRMLFSRLDRLESALYHAEGEWAPEDGNGSPRRVAVSVGPQYGPVTAKQVEDCLWAAGKRGYDDIVFAGFNFDAAAQALIQDDPNPRVRIHMANIRPDVSMGDLLKETPNSQLFTVSGLPRTRLEEMGDGQWTVMMEGVDIYDPVANTVISANAGQVAAWFLDGDYDGRTFCITQAFFPDRTAWTKLARDLKGVIDEAAFEQFSGTTSLPFPAGPHGRVAIKVIDPRGNEVMRVHALSPERVYT